MNGANRRSLWCRIHFPCTNHKLFQIRWQWFHPEKIMILCHECGNPMFRIECQQRLEQITCRCIALWNTKHEFACSTRCIIAKCHRTKQIQFDNVWPHFRIDRTAHACNQFDLIAFRLARQNWFALKEFSHHTSGTPHIDARTIACVAQQQFRCSIPQCHHIHRIVSSMHILDDFTCQTEIGNFQLSIGCQQNVLRFDVPMQNLVIGNKKPQNWKPQKMYCTIIVFYLFVVHECQSFEQLQHQRFDVGQWKCHISIVNQTLELERTVFEHQCQLMTIRLHVLNQLNHISACGQRLQCIDFPPNHLHLFFLEKEKFTFLWISSHRNKSQSTNFTDLILPSRRLTATNWLVLMLIILNTSP